jgi:hypothetical protein
LASFSRQSLDNVASIEPQPFARSELLVPAIVSRKARWGFFRDLRAKRESALHLTTRSDYHHETSIIVIATLAFF